MDEMVYHIPTIAERVACEEAGLDINRLLSVMYYMKTRHSYHEPKTDDQSHNVLICSECGDFDLYSRMKELSIKWMAYQGENSPPFYRCPRCRGLKLQGDLANLAVEQANLDTKPSTLWGASQVTGEQIDPDCLGI